MASATHSYSYSDIFSRRFNENFDDHTLIVYVHNYGNIKEPNRVSFYEIQGKSYPQVENLFVYGLPASVPVFDLSQFPNLKLLWIHNAYILNQDDKIRLTNISPSLGRIYLKQCSGIRIPYLPHITEFVLMSSMSSSRHDCSKLYHELRNDDVNWCYYNYEKGYNCNTNDYYTQSEYENLVRASIV